MKASSRLLRAAALAFVLPSALWAADTVLTNGDITKMTKAGLGDDVILAKIDQAQEVDFQLETDDIIDLKQAGVHQDVISAMLRRSTPSAAPASSSADDDFPPVTLIEASGSVTLAAVEGDHQQFAAPFVGLRHFLEFKGTAAATRTRDRRPTLELRLGRDPGENWWIVKVDPDDDEPTRGLDLESAGVWGGSHSFEPDEEFVINATRVDAGGGVWRFTPKKDLKPGEYGLYCEIGLLYDFGVDR